MSLILLVSITLRLMAFVWSLALVRQLRDWRMGFFSVLLALMALRQMFSLVKGTENWTTFVYSRPEEIPGLLVSCMVFVAIFYLRNLIHEQVNQETTLRESEARYQDLFEHAPDMYVSVDAQTKKILQCNQSVVSVTGYPKEELEGMLLFDLYHPDSMKEARQAFHTFVSLGEVKNAELQLRRKDGGKVDVMLNVSAIRDAQGRIIKSRSVWRDITSLKHAEKALRDTEDVTRQILDAAVDMVIVKDSQSRILWANKAFQDFYGMTELQLQEMIDAPFNNPQFTEQYLDDDKKVFEDGQVQNIAQEPVTRHDGEVRIFNTIKSPIFDGAGQVSRLVAVLRDITLQQQAEIDLQESERFALSTMNALSAHFCVLNAEGTILTVNESWKHFGSMNGLRSEAFTIGDNYLQVCEQATGDCSEEALVVAAGIRSVIQGAQQEFSYIYPCHSPDEQRWYAVKVTRFKGDGPIRVVVAHENLTDSKLAEQALIRSEARYRTLVEHSPYCIHLLKSDATIVSMNHAGLDMLGLQEESEIQGVCYLNLIMEKDRARVQGLFDLAVSGTSSDFEFSLTEEKIFQSSFIPIVAGGDGNMVTIMGISQDITARKKAEEKIKAANDQLHLMAHQLRFSQEEERRRIARELHDEFGQSLTGLNFDLSWVIKHLAQERHLNQKEEISSKLISMSSNIVDIIHMVRKIAGSLRPSILDDLGLVDALEWELREFQKRTGIPCQVEIAEGIQVQEISGLIATALYRVSQEFLTNVMRYAQASHVQVSLSEKAETICLDMMDDGIGITEDQINNSHSWGIIGMKERVLELHGEFRILGHPGQGTKMMIRIPKMFS